MQNAVFQITVPEGQQLDEIADIISKHTTYSAEEVLNKLNDRTFVESLISKYPDLLTNDILDSKIKHPLEGYLFPATYPFYEKEPTIDEIVDSNAGKNSISDTGISWPNGRSILVCPPIIDNGFVN